MQENAGLLNVIYQNAEMGIVGIDDVLYKIHNEKLLKEIQNEKKEYQKILKKAKHKLKENGSECKKIGMMAKISSDIYSEIKLMSNHSDEKIIEMMIEGSYKSLGLLKTKEIEYKHSDDDIKRLLNYFYGIIEDNIQNLKKLAKHC